MSIKTALAGTGIGLAIIGVSLLVGAFVGTVESMFRTKDGLEDVQDELDGLENDAKEATKAIIAFKNSLELGSGIQKLAKDVRDLRDTLISLRALGAEGSFVEFLPTIFKAFKEAGIPITVEEATAAFKDLFDKERVEAFKKGFDEASASVKEFLDRLSVKKPQGVLVELIDLIGFLKLNIDRLGEVEGFKKLLAVLEDLRKEMSGVGKEILKVQRDIDLFGLSKNERAFEDARLAGASLEDARKLLRLLRERDVLEKGKKTKADLKKEADRLRESVESPLEKFSKTMERIRFLFVEKGLIDLPTFQRLFAQARDELEGSEKEKEKRKSLVDLAPGRFGFAQFGNAIQDALLKEGEDKDTKRNNLLEKIWLEQRETNKNITTLPAGAGRLGADF